MTSLRNLDRSSAEIGLWDMGKVSVGARFRHMGGTNDAKTALRLSKETKRKIIKNREIFLSLDNYISKNICSRALWLRPLQRKLSKLVGTRVSSREPYTRFRFQLFNKKLKNPIF